MDFGLTGKTAVVAAASRGLGYAIAHRLAAEGCVVEICSRSADAISEAAQRIQAETGASVVGSPVDVADGEALPTWIGEAAERLGGVDIAIPNGGGPPASDFTSTMPADWDSAYALTLRSALMFAHSVHPHLQTSHGSMLFLTSTSVLEPNSNIALSGIFRAGVQTLAKTLAGEWAPEIRVNHLVPGRIATERVESLDRRIADREGIAPEAARALAEGSIPLGRYGEPSDFASAAAFLVSPAAAYITGATLVVDGGALRTV